MNCPSCGGDLERESVGQNVTRLYCPECRSSRSARENIDKFVSRVNSGSSISVDEFLNRIGFGDEDEGDSS